MQGGHKKSFVCGVTANANKLGFYIKLQSQKIFVDIILMNVDTMSEEISFSAIKMFLKNYLYNFHRN